MLIDLHTHTNISDGLDTPEQLVAMAKAARVSVLAITDHDTTAGWQSLGSAERISIGGSGEPHLQLVPGAEISCLTTGGMSVHMLGYLFDPQDHGLVEMMATTRDDRIPRIRKMISLLNQAEIAVTFEDVQARSDSATTVGRPHLADALIALGVVRDRNEAFARYLHNDSPFYVGHIAPSPEEAIATIKKAGGVSVLAHALAGSRGATYSLDEISDLVAFGLDGLEVDHRDHDQAARSDLRGLACDFDLLVTGSSDYHGENVGHRLAMEVTSPEVWEGILARGSGSEVQQI